MAHDPNTLEDFLDRSTWTLAELTAFLDAAFSEGEQLDYKHTGFVFPEEPKDHRLGTAAKKQLRYEVTGFANSAGGLLVLGDDSDEGDTAKPGDVIGIPRAWWGPEGPRSRIVDVLSNRIHPRLYNMPQVHAAPPGGSRHPGGQLHLRVPAGHRRRDR